MIISTKLLFFTYKLKHSTLEQRTMNFLKKAKKIF